MENVIESAGSYRPLTHLAMPRRRSFLIAAATALPMSAFGQTCWNTRGGAVTDGADADAGSSVAPLRKGDRVGKRAGDIAAPGGAQTQACITSPGGWPVSIYQWPSGAYSARYNAAAQIASGQMPLPPSTQIIGNPYVNAGAQIPSATQAFAAANGFVGGQYSDFDTLTKSAFAMGTAEAVFGPAGTMFRGGLTLLTAAFWVGWNVGTFMYLNGPSVQRNISSWMYGGGLSSWFGYTSAPTSGMIVGGGYVNGLLIVFKY